MTATFPRRLKTSLFYSIRFAFRLIPFAEPTKDRLRQWFLQRHGYLLPPIDTHKSLAGAKLRRPLIRADGRAIGHISYATSTLPDPLPATLIAYYLPQYHAIAENDEWWGRGFTEWRSVAGALPQFEGHIQPRLPADLGFYDLSNPEVMTRQAQLAREYGISAFCFYFYWFGGKTLLEKPLANWIDDPSINMPLCICWANEKWVRTWDGRGNDVLMTQEHSAEDDIAFISYISKYLLDPRYVRVDGKPILLVYRPSLLPNGVATAQRWREWWRSNGLGELHLVYVQSFERPVPSLIGFDAAVEFPPNLSSPKSLTRQQTFINPGFEGEIVDWRELAELAMVKPRPSYPLYPAVNCGWDNEPRRPSKGRVYLHASPRLYGDWLLNAIEANQSELDKSKRLVFVNAWNEWGEGAVLEPDQRLGHAYLSASRCALQKAAGHFAASPDKRPVVVLHAWYLGVLEETLLSLQRTGLEWRVIITTSPEKVASAKEIAIRLKFDVELLAFPNRGRDILPFLHVANMLIDEGIEVVLKLHCKRSVHRSDGDVWRRELIDRLVGEQRAAAAIKAFAEDHNLGIAGPAGYLMPMNYHWGANAATVEYLARRLGLNIPAIDSEKFISGSMFWVRLQSIRPLLDAHLGEDEFEEEQAQVDGTMAHAIERIFCVCTKYGGFEFATIEL